MEASFAASAVHRRPHDLDFARAIEGLQTGGRTAEEMVSAYQRRNARNPENKLQGNAVWRLKQILDPAKFAPAARALVDASRHLVDDQSAPVSGKMRTSKDFYIT